MGLIRDYPQWFESIWEAYPKFPRGRSLKADAFEACETKRIEDNWESKDISQLIKIIMGFKKNAPQPRVFLRVLDLGPRGVVWGGSWGVSGDF